MNIIQIMFLRSLRNPLVFVLTVVCIAFSGLIGMQSARSAPAFQATLLQQLDVGSLAYSINDSGMIVGAASSIPSPLRPSNYAAKPAQWSLDGSGSRMALPAGYIGGAATSISNSGNVTGFVYILDPYTADAHTQAFISDGTTISPGGPNNIDAVGLDVNDAGDFVGRSSNGTLLYRAGAVANINTGTASNVSSWSILNDGRIFGNGSNMSAPGRFEAAQLSTIATPSVLMPGVPFNSSLLAANSNGVGAGATIAAGTLQPRAAIFSGGTATTVGPTFTNSQFTSINDANHAVGTWWAGGSYSDPRAVYYDGTTFYDLNTLVTLQPGWVLSDAMDINNHTQILAWATHDNQTRSYVLTLAPEPAWAGSLICGVFIMRRARHCCGLRV